MVGIESLKKRVEAIYCSTNVPFYRIDVVTDHMECPIIYRTLDEALSEVYADARKRRLGTFHVLSFPFESDLDGNFTGFVWTRSKRPELNLPSEILRYSTFTVFDCFGGRHDILAYPEEKPELEGLNILVQRRLDWCNGNGYASIEEWEEHCRADLPELYNDRYESDIDILKRHYRDAGYSID